MRVNYVDYNYPETLHIKLITGRSFSKDFATDSSAIVINSAAQRIMGLDDPVGKRVNYNNRIDFTIIGVMQDYNFRSLHTRIEPLILLLNPEYSNVICARIKSADIPETIDFLKGKWKEFVSDYPFDYGFLDERLDNLYRSERRIGNILKSFTFLAIFVSCLGLFGLASFMAMRRIKEIGVRKVLGASVSQIITLQLKEFSQWILLANVISWPLVYWGMKKWLHNFAYQTDIHFWIFGMTGVLTLLIAWVTVSYQAIKAATANPSESLRYE